MHVADAMTELHASHVRTAAHAAGKVSVTTCCISLHGLCISRQHYSRSTATALTADQRVSVDAPDFWTAAYTLRRCGAGQLACPAFLQPLAQGILSTGKCLILLRAHQGMHQR